MLYDGLLMITTTVHIFIATVFGGVKMGSRQEEECEHVLQRGMTLGAGQAGFESRVGCWGGCDL